MTRHYLDGASCAPLRAIARQAMTEAFHLPTADPGRLHTEALEVRAHLEEARRQVAGFVGARPSELVFTASASEAIALAVRGSLARSGPGAVVLGTAVEHSAVRLSAGDAFVPVPVDGDGLVDPGEFAGALRSAGERVALAACQFGNHEMGAVQDVEAVASICADLDVPCLIDAAQAAAWLPLDCSSLAVDFVAISGPKLGGPLGTGALVVKRGRRVPPLVVGGAQERGRRAGLENVPALLGLAAACSELTASQGHEAATVARMTDRLRRHLSQQPGIEIYGPPDAERRLPHLVCCGIAGIEPQAILLELDRAGVAAHSGSACAGEELEPSPVLAAMGVDAHRSLRLSLHHQSVPDGIDALLGALPGIIERLLSLR